MTQLELFKPRPLFRDGWLGCPCGLAFWIWPVGTGRDPGRCTGQTGAPDLRRWRGWTCWRGIRRMTPFHAQHPTPITNRKDRTNV